MDLSRQERKEKITTLRRQQILEAALDIFSQKGFAAATTAEIAREAGVAEGTIFNYFPNKRNLLIEVIKTFIINIPLLELIDRLPQGDTDNTLRNILENRFNLIESGIVSHIPMLMSEVQRDPELKSIWKTQVLQPFLSRMEKVYETLAVTGKTRNIKPAVLVRVVGGMILGFLMLKIMEGDESPLNRMPRDNVIDSMIDLLLHGLLNGPGQQKIERRSDR